MAAQVHDRMPVILHEKDYDAWMDPAHNDVESLKKLLVPYPDAPMDAYEVSKAVNTPKNDDPSCILPVVNP